MSELLRNVADGEEAPLPLPKGSVEVLGATPYRKPKPEDPLPTPSMTFEGQADAGERASADGPLKLPSTI